MLHVAMSPTDFKGQQRGVLCCLLSPHLLIKQQFTLFLGRMSYSTESYQFWKLTGGECLEPYTFTLKHQHAHCLRIADGCRLVATDCRLVSSICHLIASGILSGLAWNKISTGF